MDNIDNYKTLKQNKLEDLIIEILENDNPLKEKIIDHYINKFKFKSHKKLNNKISFIECALKYKQYDLLNKYVPNLQIHTPHYNIINTCVNINNVELLQNYIKKIGINKFQYIDGYTPLMIAIKNKYIECLNILLQNYVPIHIIPNTNISPLEYLFDNILEQYKNYNITHDEQYIKILNLLLPKINNDLFDTNKKHNFQKRFSLLSRKNIYI